MNVTVKTAEQLRITAEEFDLFKEKLGHTPNFNELCDVSGMWSEHCSNNNSIMAENIAPGRKENAGESVGGECRTDGYR